MGPGCADRDLPLRTRLGECRLLPVPTGQSASPGPSGLPDRGHHGRGSHGTGRPALVGDQLCDPGDAAVGAPLRGSLTAPLTHDVTDRAPVRTVHDRPGESHAPQPDADDRGAVRTAVDPTARDGPQPGAGVAGEGRTPERHSRRHRPRAGKRGSLDPMQHPASRRQWKASFHWGGPQPSRILQRRDRRPGDRTGCRFLRSGGLYAPARDRRRRQPPPLLGAVPGPCR